MGPCPSRKPYPCVAMMQSLYNLSDEEIEYQVRDRMSFTRFLGLEFEDDIRSKDWLKIKTGKRQEVVIVGFTAPRRSRKYFGALVIAHGPQWRYAGHVGTGFSHAMLEELHAKLWLPRTDKSPFQRRVEDEAVTTWVKPKLVAEVKFTEWTSAGQMRHPAFLGLRGDKNPEDVILEKEARFPK